MRTGEDGTGARSGLACGCSRCSLACDFGAGIRSGERRFVYIRICLDAMNILVGNLPAEVTAFTALFYVLF